MEVRHGSAIVKQIAAGPLSFYHRPVPPIQEHSHLTPQKELTRFARAQRQAAERLDSLCHQAHHQAGAEAAAIFSIHSMLLEDEDLTDDVRKLIFTHHNTAEWAVKTVGKRYAKALADLPDPYMQARAADIRDVSRQIIFPLIGTPGIQPPPHPTILVADLFLPSEVLLMARKALGLVSLRGSPDSHTALLLQAYHIPVLIGLDLDEQWEGHPALLDGHTGTLYIDPERALLEELRLCHQADGAPTGTQF